MKIIRLNDMNLSAAAREAAAALSAGEIVLYPTDTLYGLAADATNAQALTRLREIKGREKKNPISIVVGNHSELERYAELSDAARELALRHLPGALTLVVPGKGGLSEDILSHGAVGIRIPNHPFSKALSEAFGRPYTATSANKSGHLTPSTVYGIIDQLGPVSEHLTVIIDAGEHPGGTPSTVVHALGDTFYIIREGALSREELGL